MKAVILAAGLGTRLRPLTNTIPKPLVTIGDKPLLEYHFDSLRKYGINSAAINTHYLADHIKAFINAYLNGHPDFSVLVSYEPELLGSAGTLQNLQQFLHGEKEFIVTYSDNLTNINYEKLIDFHRQKGGLATVASYYEQHPETKGIMVIDSEKRIQRFIEKPRKEEMVSHIANGGVYVYNKEVFKYLAKIKQKPADIGQHLLPILLDSKQPLYAYEMSEFLLDIGTLESYKQANEIIHKLKF